MVLRMVSVHSDTKLAMKIGRFHSLVPRPQRCWNVTTLGNSMQTLAMLCHDVSSPVQSRPSPHWAGARRFGDAAKTDVFTWSRADHVMCLTSVTAPSATSSMPQLGLQLHLRHQ